MRKVLGLILLALPLFAAPLFAQRTAVFPRFNSGAQAGGVWSSVFFFANQGILPVPNILVSFYDQNGNALTVTSNLGTNSSFTFDLAAGATQVIRITPGSTFIEGYTLVEYPDLFPLAYSPSPVRGTQIYKYEANGVVYVEVGVPQQEMGNNFSFPVEVNSSQRTYTAIALTNLSSVAQTLVVNLVRPNGTIQSTATKNLAGGQHDAKFIDQELFPGLNNFSGSISVSSPDAIGVLTFRQDKDAFGGTSTDGGPIMGPFALTSAPIPEVEPNDDDLHAQAIAGSTIVTGTIDPADDIDFFAVSGNQGQILTVLCDTQGTNSPLDSILEIWDQNTQPVAYNDQNGLSPAGYPQNDSFLQVVLPATGVYYIMLTDFYPGGGAPDFSYRLHIRLQ